jgi:hypothetical protein
VQDGLAVSDDYLWGVHPRSADDPLVASGATGDRKAAQREVELVLGTRPAEASYGTVTGPRGFHLVCRRDGLGGFNWEDRNGSRVAGPQAAKGAGAARRNKRDKDAGRLYREVQGDYWDTRARRARRGLAFRGFTRGVTIVVIMIVVLVIAGYVVERAGGARIF